VFFGNLSAILTIFLSAALALWFYLARGDAADGQFYGAISHQTMVTVFAGASAVIAGLLLIGLVRCWRESGERFAKLPALSQGLRQALTLTYLDGGGEGCTYPGEQRSRARWWFHHLTFYGFMFCFASTSVAAIYHYAFGLRAPYGYFSMPVMLGTIGGIGLLAGPAGLLWLKRRQDPATRAPEQAGMDVTFIVLLFLTSATGLLLLALRATSAMSLLLSVHLGIVLALFLMMPYGKFVHGIYRLAALVRYALERSRTKGLHSPEN
jgi:citrate/tricarballylate utilization protein